MSDNLSMRVTTDMDPNGATSTGIRTVADSVVRRLDQAPGSLYYTDPEYGAGIVWLIGRNLSPFQVRQIVIQQLLLDERITDVECSVVPIGETTTLYLTCETPEGSFDLSVTADRLDISKISIKVPGDSDA